MIILRLKTITSDDVIVTIIKSVFEMIRLNQSDDQLLVTT